MSLTILSQPNDKPSIPIPYDIIKDKEEVWISKREYQEKGVAVLSKLGVS